MQTTAVATDDRINLAPHPEESAPWPYNGWGRAFRFLALPFDLVYRVGVTRTHVEGVEHLANLPERVILAGTHRGFGDVPLVREGLKRSPAKRLANRLVVAAAAEGAGWRSLLGRYAQVAFGLFPLRRGQGREDSLRDLARAAGSGNAVLLFPQGTHAEVAEERADSPRVRFRTGVAYLAAALDATVVPFGVAGTERLMPPDVAHVQGRVVAGVPLALRRGPLALVFGAPVCRAVGESPHAFAARLQQASYALTRRAEALLESAALTGNDAVRVDAAVPGEPGEKGA